MFRIPSQSLAWLAIGGSSSAIERHGGLVKSRFRKDERRTLLICDGDEHFLYATLSTGEQKPFDMLLPFIYRGLYLADEIHHILSFSIKEGPVMRCLGCGGAGGACFSGALACREEVAACAKPRTDGAVGPRRQTFLH